MPRGLRRFSFRREREGIALDLTLVVTRASGVADDVVKSFYDR